MQDQGNLCLAESVASVGPEATKLGVGKVEQREGAGDVSNIVCATFRQRFDEIFVQVAGPSLIPTVHAPGAACANVDEEI
ncbi:hypothetical protein V6S67_19600 [Arthrobacter sp. Soc17.1.1.1]|uniref:hypothetical protein n=1 Tax=Arthrobacter sp. Soc17.1.1.1 TaxID=3121277 RepID=UPI002FE4F828